MLDIQVIDDPATATVALGPTRTGRPRGGRPRSSCDKGGQTPGDPGCGFRGSLSVGHGAGRFQQRTHRGHHETRFRSITMNLPPAAARIAWWSTPFAAEIRTQRAVMSVKKEASGHRSVQVEVEVPGTAEEVWQDIATGPGIPSWFVPAEFEEQRSDKCSAVCVAAVYAWSRRPQSCNKSCGNS